MEIVKCPYCNSGNVEMGETKYYCYKCGKEWDIPKIANDDYPQDSEENEYRYLSPAWLDEIARGLTAGAKKHPGETWRTIPCEEHLWRAMRHISMYLGGDRKENHLINASMRLMMAKETEATELSREQWERLMHEKGCG